MKKGFYILLLFSFLHYASSGKEKKSTVDSLIQLSQEHWKTEPDKALAYSNEAYEYALQTDDTLQIVKAMLSLAESYRMNNINDTAIQLMINAQSKAALIGDTVQMAIAGNRIGAVYYGMEYYGKALKAWKQALEMHQKSNNKRGVNNCLNNIAAVLFHKGQYKKSIEYFKKSLKLDEEMGDMNGAITTLTNIAGIYTEIMEYEPAKKHHQKALLLCKSHCDSSNLAQLHSNIGRFYLDLKECEKAFPYLDKALSIYKRLNISHKIMLCYANQSDYYYCIGDYKNAYRYEQMHSQLSDSLNTVEKTKAIAELETKYQSEKKERENKILKQNNRIQNLQLEKQEQNILRQRFVIFGTGGILILIVALAIQLFRNNKIKQKANEALSKQKRLVEKKNRELENAFHEIEEKNLEITDSIAYAKRIQAAILPSKSELSEHLNNYFLFYQPKDMVAGDFYWLESVGGTMYLAIADCTGHGVPGAIVSVVCSNALNQSVYEFGLKEPGEILTETRKLVVNRFAKSDGLVRDGMDISLIAWDKKKNQMKWAGAYNPLWIVRDRELIEIKADKQPIGAVDQPKPFTTHEVEHQKNDLLYMFTDGYADQFGGEKGKKLKIKNFKKLLLSVHDKSMVTQGKMMEQYFHDWKGDLEQIDDVCVLGVRV